LKNSRTELVFSQYKKKTPKESPSYADDLSQRVLMSQQDQAQYRQNRGQQNRNPRPIPTSGIIKNADERGDSNHHKQTGNEGMQVGRGVR
jgi:hypothetical protein